MISEVSMIRGGVMWTIRGGVMWTIAYTDFHIRFEKKECRG